MEARTNNVRLFKGAPPDPPSDIVSWAEQYVRLVGSVRSETYDRNITPWTIEPLRRCADSETNIVTLIKPVQTGGTRVGLIAICWWLKFGYGALQYNWEKDEKALAKWQNETLPTIKACKEMDWSGERFEAVSCYAKFKRTFLRSQGVFNPDSLDSDSIPFQVNEEVHAWKAGHLAKARGRQTAVWLPKAVDISNAGERGGQLDQCWQDGTMQRWEVKCPGCGQFHVMRTRWEDSKPELGGLRYKCLKLENGRYNYNTIQIWYQMPCGQQVADNPIERRALSLSGRYSEPTNAGAHLSHRSYTYDAVTVDFISWLQLIQEKHSALRALKAGDVEPWRRYITERECDFFHEDLRPFAGAVVVTSGAVKNRKGVDGEAAKIWAADWQQGFKTLGELTHYWLCIESVRQDCSSMVIFAGIVDGDIELVQTLADHGITSDNGLADGVIDASKNTKQILSLCYRQGMNAVMGNASGKGSWKWPDGTWRYYSPKKYIYAELNMPPRFDRVLTRDGWVEHPDEPFILMYSKAGILKNHFFLREMKARVLDADKDAPPDQYIERIVPEDIGEDYLQHLEAWERDPSATGPKKQGEVEGFKQIRRQDHCLSATCYIDLLKDVSGWLGNQLSRMGIRPKAQ